MKEGNNSMRAMEDRLRLSGALIITNAQRYFKWYALSANSRWREFWEGQHE